MGIQPRKKKPTPIFDKQAVKTIRQSTKRIGKGIQPTKEFLFLKNVQHHFSPQAKLERTKREVKKFETIEKLEREQRKLKNLQEEQRMRQKEMQELEKQKREVMMFELKKRIGGSIYK